MRFKRHIDSQIYRVLETGSRFAISGWYFVVGGGEAAVQVYLNGKEVDFETREILRKDVSGKYARYHVGDKSGFRITVPVPKGKMPTSLKLIVKTRTHTYILLDLNQKDIEKIKSTSTLQYLMEDVSLEKINDGVVFRMRGMAFSCLPESEVVYQIVDECNRPVKFTNRALCRDDLYHMGITEKENQYCGFQMEFSGDAKHTYWLYISDKKTKVRKQIKYGEVVKAHRIAKDKQFARNIVQNLTLDNIKKGFSYMGKHGVKGVIERIRKGHNANGLPYKDWYAKNQMSATDLEKQRSRAFEKMPKISILVPTYKTPIHFFKEMVDSVRAQTYSNWELCLGDGSEGDAELEKVMSEYQKADPRIRYRILEKNKGISGNTNGALELATGEYIGLLDHDDVLEPDALYEVVKALNQDDYDILYTDEDKVSGDLKEHSDPNFKPDWSPDLFCSHNYITHFFVVKKKIVDLVGGFRSEYDGAQDYDLMFRCIENAERIKHIPKILYNWRMHAASVAGDPASKMYAYEAGRKAIEAHYKRVGIDAQVEHTEDALWGMYHTIYNTPGNPLISIIIPNKDHVEDLDKCLTSLYQNNIYQHFEVIIVENNSEQEETFSYYETIQNKHDNIIVLTWEKEFNYAAINNYGVSRAKGDYLLFLNNDTETINDTAVKELIGCCMRDDVGIVGAKLLYEDDTVQHAGIVVGFGGFAGHVFTGIGKDDYGFMVRPRINCNYSAVTAACMMVDRRVFEEVNGFTEEFKVGLNDVDFCLKVRKAGKLVVYNAFSLWHHYESKSRGYEDTEEKVKRFEGEVRLFQEKWKDILKNGDPYYNKNFPIEFGPFRLG